MRPLVLVIACAAFVGSSTIVLVFIHLFSINRLFVALIVGAIVGSHVGIFTHHKQPNAEPSRKVKTQLGVALAMCATTFGILLQSIIHLFKFPEVSIPVAAAGSFIFPFMIFDTMWNALNNKTSKNNPRD